MTRALIPTTNVTPHRTITDHDDVFASLPADLEPMIVPLLRIDLEAADLPPGGVVHALYHDSFGVRVEYRRAPDGKVELTDETIANLRDRGQEIEDVESFADDIESQFFEVAALQGHAAVRLGGEPDWVQAPENTDGLSFIAQVNAFALGGGGQTLYLFHDAERDVIVQLDQMT